MTEQDYRAEIVERARAYIGTNKAKRGRGRHEGVDCGGIPMCVGREVGALDPTWDVFEENTVDYAYAIEGKLWGPWPGCTRVADPEKAAGDILMLAKSAGQDMPYYCGILGEKNEELTLIRLDPKVSTVREQPLKELNPDGTRLGVVWRFNYPPENAREGVRPTRPIVTPELIR